MSDPNAALLAAIADAGFPGAGIIATGGGCTSLAVALTARAAIRADLYIGITDGDSQAEGVDLAAEEWAAVILYDGSEQIHALDAQGLDGIVQAVTRLAGLADLVPLPLPLVGERVVLKLDVERYPHFTAPAGMTGTVTEVDPERLLFSVKLDEPLPGAEDWDNEVMWSDDEAVWFWDDVEVDPRPAPNTKPDEWLMVCLDGGSVGEHADDEAGLAAAIAQARTLKQEHPGSVVTIVF